MKPNPIIVRLSFETSGSLICVSVFHGWPQVKTRPQKPASASGFPPLGPARARPPPSGSPELWPDLRSSASSSSTCVRPAVWPAAATARGALRRGLDTALPPSGWTCFLLLPGPSAGLAIVPGPHPGTPPKVTEPELGNPLFPRL